MARLTCRCGAALNNQSVPNDVELWVYTNKEWDAIFADGGIEAWKIPLPKYDVWRCPFCERVLVFEEGNSKAIKAYRLEGNSSSGA